MGLLLTKVVGPTSLTAGIADTEIGGGPQKAPEWSPEMLGVDINAVLLTPTAAESAIGQFYVKSPDFNPNPSVGLWTARTTGGAGTSVPAADGHSHYWPLNLPISGGSAFDLYGLNYETPSAAPWMQGTFYFGDGRYTMPSRLDCFPHVIRRMQTTGAATATAAARQLLPAFTLTGVDGILEFWGTSVKVTSASSKPVIGYFEAISNGFKSSPIQFPSGSVSGLIGTIGGSAPDIKFTDAFMGTGPTCIITPYYNQGAGVAVTTDLASCGCTFVRGAETGKGLGFTH